MRVLLEISQPIRSTSTLNWVYICSGISHMMIQLNGCKYLKEQMMCTEESGREYLQDKAAPQHAFSNNIIRKSDNY